MGDGAQPGGQGLGITGHGNVTLSSFNTAPSCTGAHQGTSQTVNTGSLGCTSNGYSVSCNYGDSILPEKTMVWIHCSLQVISGHLGRNSVLNATCFQDP